MSRHARSSPHSYSARLSSVCARSPHRKRIFVAGIAARRLQRKQETARTSCYARPSPHSYPARLRRTCARSPRRFPRRQTAQARPYPRTSPCQPTDPARGSVCRNTPPPRLVQHGGFVVGHDPKPAPQAHSCRRHCSPQASARAGIRAHVTPRAFIAALLPRASPQGMHPKPAPQVHLHRGHRSPQASTQAGNRAHVVLRVPIAAFSPRASP